MTSILYCIDQDYIPKFLRIVLTANNASNKYYIDFRYETPYDSIKSFKNLIVKVLIISVASAEIREFYY